MSEDYINNSKRHDARRNFRRKSEGHVDHRQPTAQKFFANFIPHAQTASLNFHPNNPKVSKQPQNQDSFDYGPTKHAKNVLIVSNHPTLPTKTVLTTWKTESPTNTTSSVATKYEQMGKTSYKQHMMKVRRSKFTLSNNSHSIQDKMWSGYNKSMHPCRLRLKIKEKLLNNRMIKIVMYLGTLTRETKRRNQIKQLFQKTMRTILFQTRVNEIEQRLVKFYKKQARLQLQIQEPMLHLFGVENSIHAKLKTISTPHRHHNIHLSSLANSRLSLNKAKALKGWIRHYSSESSIFRLLGEKKLNNVLNNINFSIKHYRAGQRIFSQGSAAKYFFIVLSGTVSIWAEKYDSQLASNADLSNRDPYTVPQMQQNVIPNPNKNLYGRASYVSMMQVFFQCFEKCQELKTGDTFGQLAFENTDSCHHSTAIAKESCILAAVDKADYEKFFQNLVLSRQQETLDVFRHFKTSSEETFSLERCNLLKNVAETVSYDTAEVIHGTLNENNTQRESDSDDIYLVVQGSVCAYYFEDTRHSGLLKNSLYNRTTQLRNIVKKAPLLKLGKGELLDPRFIIANGLKLRAENEENLISITKTDMKTDNIYFMATSPVTLLKIKAQSFFRISRFDFWSVYNASQVALKFALKQLDYQTRIKTALKNKQNGNIQNVKKRCTTWEKRQKKWQREENLQMFMKTEESKQLDEKQREEATVANQHQLSHVTESEERKIPTINSKLPRPLSVQRCTSTDLILMMH